MEFLTLICILIIASLVKAWTIPYFAYGSNCYVETMTSLRRIRLVNSTAAVLPGYKLRFNIPGIPAVEPSWACVEKCSKDNVHGVLYTLTPQDFARISFSEGVPFGYQWTVVDVVPYQGDGDRAGEMALSSSSVCQAYTLVSNNPLLPHRDIPPSKAYRDLLIRGAKDFQMDQEHIDKLESIPVGFTFGEGYVAKNVLEAAEQRNNRRRSHQGNAECQGRP
jgi:Gamma-glutamyl cyclotransferase, AIG2-like